MSASDDRREPRRAAGHVRRDGQHHLACGRTATATQKIPLSVSRDIPFNKLVLSQSNVRRIKGGVAIEELAVAARYTCSRAGLYQPSMKRNHAGLDL